MSSSKGPLGRNQKQNQENHQQEYQQINRSRSTNTTTSIKKNNHHHHHPNSNYLGTTTASMSTRPATANTVSASIEIESLGFPSSSSTQKKPRPPSSSHSHSHSYSHSYTHNDARFNTVTASTGDIAPLIVSSSISNNRTHHQPGLNYENKHQNKHQNQSHKGQSQRQRQHQHDPVSGHHPDASFFDFCTPIHSEMKDQQDHGHGSRAPQHHQRDFSHDLSLNPRNVTRDSLVNNMLLSLDQFSISQSTNTSGYHHSDRNDRDDDDDDSNGQQSPKFFDIPRFRSAHPATNISGLPKSQSQPQSQSQSESQPHWKSHNHSYSSDFDMMGDDSSRISSQTVRRRRSDSSNNIPDNYSRLNSPRQPATPRAKHVRGNRGSKSSSLASADHSYLTSSNTNSTLNPRKNGSSQRRAQKISRTASFDNGQNQTQSSLHQSTHSNNAAQPAFQSDFDEPFLSRDFAPTPTVPGGPRRSPSVPNIPPPPPEPLEQWSSPRARSTGKSARSSSARGKEKLRDMAPSMPNMSPSADIDSAPAPSVGYGKSKDGLQGGGIPSNNASPMPREKPGFFKRVFGGFQNSNTTSPGVSAADPGGPHKTGPMDSMNVEGVSSTSKSGPLYPPPSRDVSSAHSNHPTLQKKPSSFFRRRKKSVSEEAPPIPNKDLPPVPLINLKSDKGYRDGRELQKDHKDLALAKSSDVSPASSLRQVMDPYLHESSTTAPVTPARKKTSGLRGDSHVMNGDHEDTNPTEYKRDFSPDYEPNPKARIRKVQSTNLGGVDGAGAATTATPSKRSVQKETKGNSFLDLDCGSDNDDEQSSKAKNLASDANKDLVIKDGLRPKKKSSFILASSADTTPHHSNIALPLEGTTQTSSLSPKGPTTNPDFRVDSPSEPSPKATKPRTGKERSLDEPEFVVGEPTEDDRLKAQQIYDGVEDFIQKEKAASWMGEEGVIRQRTLQAYMELYDFESQSVVQALRQVCGRLVLRAETQQVDRILVAFSNRWCACNSNHGFKATDIIHTICYSIMLLNTDLHMADIEQKMTRSQFVKNTMGTVTQALDESVPEAFDRRPSILPEKNLTMGSEQTDASTSGPTEMEKKSFRNSFRPPPRIDTDSDSHAVGCGPLVKSPFYGNRKGWEEQVEIVLKAIYNSIRDERLPLFGAEPTRTLTTAASQSSLSVMGILRRTPSVLSKAPSEGGLSTRGRIPGDTRGTGSRWTSKSRSRPGLGRAGFNSSRTSFDDGNSLWSPAWSSGTWSRQSLGRTQTTMSQDSFGSALRGDYQQSIGFANALSQAIIRDEDYDGAPSILSSEAAPTPLLEDESLEITGPPWVKEGMVIHKHHLDGVDKKAKERQWTEVFAVIQKGQMSLFSFNSTKSMRQKNRSKLPGRGGPVGGGNWQDNATSLGTFSLRQTLASALPPPGYSRTRPHVWALSLPTGAVHLFQVGTAEIIKEFVTTVNYWSARLSTHPLIGGISNVEYGWSDVIVNNALVSAINETTTENTPPQRPTRPPASGTNGRKGSISSFRSTSVDHATAVFTHATGRGKLPGDRVNIADWTPPTQSLRPSNQSEAEQLETLTTYVKSIEDELQLHNQLRSPMLLAFTPRGPNASKSMANWERKSAYLLREIVKFRTYVDCLQHAEVRKQEVYAERNLAHRAARGELSDREMEVSDDEEEEREEIGGGREEEELRA